MAEGELDLRTLPDDELVLQMHNNIYDSFEFLLSCQHHRNSSKVFHLLRGTRGCNPLLCPTIVN